MQFSLEWKELEKRLKEEEEQKLAAQEVERLLHFNSEREEEERRRRRLMEFEEELRKIEEVTLVGLSNFFLFCIIFLKLGEKLIE